ncbi:DNA (cytosine-5)-methyltransferase 1, partial [Coemansia sp. RSA 2618]
GLYARHLLSVSHFDVKQPGEGAAPAAAGASAAKADAWKKRYTEVTKTKQQVEDAKGIVGLADLQGHTSVRCFQSDGVRCVNESRLPSDKDDRYYYGEALVVPVENGESDQPSNPISIKIGETVLVSAMSPLPGYDAGSLWESADTDGDSAALNEVTASATALVRVVQITSIMHMTNTERWTFHGRLLLPGRDTVLQEVALANEWYLVDSCRTYCINSSICGKVEIPFIKSAQNIDVNEWISERRLFCRFWYDGSCGMFEDVNTHVQGTGKRTSMACRSCTRKNWTNDAKIGRAISGAEHVTRDSEQSDASSAATTKKHTISKYLKVAKVKDVEYHVSDTVYILSEHSDQPFQIGYILKIFNGSSSSSWSKNGRSSVQAEVQILKRVRVLPPSKRPPGTDREYDDERHLYWTPLTQIFSVSSFRGKCWVAHPDEIGTSLVVYKDSD